MFRSPEETLNNLERVGYFTDLNTATAVFLAGKIHRPIMLEGPAGAGKTNLLKAVTEQDIARGVPTIFIDGKGDKKLLDDLLPAIEAAGRMQDLGIIDPMRPEISVRYNPFWAPQGNAEDHVAFVFESFDMEKDFFEGHQCVYLENIARVLHYSGRRFNFHDVLVCAYDQNLLKKQMKTLWIAWKRMLRSPDSRR